MKVRANIETMSLNDIYKDYDIIKDLSNKYYKASPCSRLMEAADAMLEVIKTELVKRGLKDLETKHNKNVAEKITDNYETCNVNDDSHDEENNTTTISKTSIVYTNDGGKTFRHCTQAQWKYDMGIPVGYVIGSNVETNEEGTFITICSNQVFDTMTLFGYSNIDEFSKEYEFCNSLFDASNNYCGEENTTHLYNSLKDAKISCAITLAKEYKVKNIENNSIKWYVPSCGELKEIDKYTVEWVKQTFGLESFHSLLSSTMVSPDEMWVYNLSSLRPNAINFNWDFNILLFFAKVKID